MSMSLRCGKYVVYGSNGKVLLVCSDRSICLAFMKGN